MEDFEEEIGQVDPNMLGYVVTTQVTLRVFVTAHVDDIEESIETVARTMISDTIEDSGIGEVTDILVGLIETD